MTNRHLVVLLLCFMLAIASLAASAQEPPTPQQLIDAAHKVSDPTKLGLYTLTANVVVDSGDKKTVRTGHLLIARDRDRTRQELELAESGKSDSSWTANYTSFLHKACCLERD